MNKMNKISPEKLERRREEYIEEKIIRKQDQVNCPLNFNQAFRNKLCNIEIQGIQTTGIIINADNNGVLIERDDDPFFISWNEI